MLMNILIALYILIYIYAQWYTGFLPVPEGGFECVGAEHWEASWWGSEAGAWVPGSC